MRKDVVNMKKNQVKFLELKNTLYDLCSRSETTKEKIPDWEKIFAIPVKELVLKYIKYS